MKIIPSSYTNNNDLPLKLKLSFETIFEYLENIAKNENHYLNATAVQLLDEYKQYPILRSGFDDFSYLETYNKEIDKLLDLLFPDMLQTNEIKAASIPFEFTSFKLSKRFEKILENAGEDYTLKLRNFDEENIYILTCTFILAYYYGHHLDFRRPFYFDIPSKETGITKHYRTLFNGDFFTVKPLENAPEITQKDIDVLLDNFHNIAIWKEKFPPNSYEFKGFGLMTLIDVTPDETLSSLKEILLNKNNKSFDDLSKSISNLYGSGTINFGVSIFNKNNDNISVDKQQNANSIINFNKDNSSVDYSEFFCNGIISKVFEDNELLAISDVEKYGKSTNYNGFYKAINSQGIKSIILVPIKLKDGLIAVLELVSVKKQELNSINAYKLKDVIPVFEIAINGFMEDFDNKLESIIQENYTSLHPTVKWRFYEEAKQHLFSLENNDKPYNLNSIVFENVIPLYGQSDIKGSSTARNEAITTDLIKQLNLAAGIIKKASDTHKLPIYKDLHFRIQECLNNIKNGLKSGDESNLVDFLQNDIYPAFNHLKTFDKNLKAEISQYLHLLDPKHNVIYEKRKMYDKSVDLLNENLVNFIDKKQEEAQEMFPHYFERYKTDGIDYNMYIGQSLVNNKAYDSIYLQNLRLWQLQMMCEAEQIVYNLKDQLEYPLEIASLILVHNNPLSIKFRMDEKRFDVDGAYNIRYEIIKKRIDKIHIKNSTERLTQPGKIAIIYSHNKDVPEYLKHIKYLQANNLLSDSIEDFELEDLQGISGLKALRINIVYKNTSAKHIFKNLKNVNLN